MSRKESLKESVKVVCRVRPQLDSEVSKGGHTCVNLTNTSIEVNHDDGSNSFGFDQVFGMDSRQEDVFNYCATPLIKDVLNGYNATIFAYGQTSSGKTYTMEGTDIHHSVHKGIIPRTVEALFAGVSEADENIEFCFKASYVEIYCEKVRDLLDNHRVKTNLMIREDKTQGIYIAGVTEEYVTSEEELLGIMQSGAVNRAVAATGMNEGSSRSHSVFSITVSQRDVSNATSKAGKLVLVDLAGSETVRKTNATGQQLEEAKTINKSLSALGQVIYALTDEKATHVPYRDSKLTRILQDSLGGNAKTALIINCSPSSFNATETVSTLRFGTRAKSITNKVVKNETRSVEELEALLLKAERAIDTQQGHIMALAAQLQAYQNDGASNEGGVAARNESEAGLIDMLQSKIESLQMELDEEREESNRKDKENEKLSILLSEKEAVLIEAGGLMQDAQHLYENAKARSEQLVREKADACGELESLKAQIADDIAKARFELQEFEVTVETYRAENAKLRQEIAEMSGDDMRNERELRNEREDRTAATRRAVQNTPDRPPSPPTERSPSRTPPPGDGQPTLQHRSSRVSERGDRRKSTSAESSQVLARDLNISGRHEDISELVQDLKDMLNVMNIAREDKSQILQWGDNFNSTVEKWYEVAEDKFAAFERGGAELGRRIKDLESQRTRLEKDLEMRTDKVMQQQLEMDIIRNESRSRQADEIMTNREQYQMKSLQQRLEQLVAVHRQLLRKFASLELENSELRKKLLLRDERIKHLESNSKVLTGNLRQQAERHITELTNLREQIQELKVEHLQRMEGRTAEVTPVIQHHHQPRIIRGGHSFHDKDAENKPKSLRGGGGKHADGDGGDRGATFAKQATTVSSGLISRLLGSGPGQASNVSKGFEQNSNRHSAGSINTNHPPTGQRTFETYFSEN